MEIASDSSCIRAVEKESIQKEVFRDLKEVGDSLKSEAPGLVVFDLDFTLKPKEYELGMGGHQPGRIPEDSIDLLKDLHDMGWRILVVTNQPKKGHQISKMVNYFYGKKYPIFPNSIYDVLGVDNVLGGDGGFLWKEFKKSMKAVNETAMWISDNQKSVMDKVYFVGDRESDGDFADEVCQKTEEIINSRVKALFMKVKGFQLPESLKGLEKFIP